MELGIVGVPRPHETARIAQFAEGLGFASLLLVDSQNLAPEVWSHLQLAAAATERIRLGPGVSNSVTRDPAVTACAAITLQVESRGRALLGLGRGDSSVQRIGKRPDRLASFERYVVALQAYLRGEAVDRDGFASRIEWLAGRNVRKVPVEIAATGPRMIELAARHADAVVLAVGADSEHLGGALARARAAADRAGRTAGAVRYGAFITCAINPERAVALDAVRGAAATFARFSSFAGSPIDELPAPLASAARYLREHYDMREHVRSAAHARALPEEFVDWFAIAGPVAHALGRFAKLKALGLDFCHVVPGSADSPGPVIATSIQLLSTEVVPAMR